MGALGASLSRRGFSPTWSPSRITFAGATGMYAFENETAGGLSSYGEALRWTGMIMTTMASQFGPPTVEGRVLCVFLALYAFAVFGYVTATLAPFFVGRDAENADAELAGSGSITALQADRRLARRDARGQPGRIFAPGIVMSLRCGQWNEVGLVGLEDLAYRTMSLRAINHSCPGVVPEGSGPLISFALNLSQQSVGRIMEGQVQNRQEAERAFFLFMNTPFNQPGCTVDYLGNIVGCVSQQDHAAAQEFFMTSCEAQSDMRTLAAFGLRSR